MNTKAKVSIYGVLMVAALAVRAQDPDRLSYAVGMNMAVYLQAQGIPLDADSTAKAVRDVLAGKPTLLTSDEARREFLVFQGRQAEIRRERLRLESEKNRAEGTAFLATNKNQPGVITLPDGLQYRVIEEGSGTPPNSGDIVKVNYRGTMLDGKEFDNTYKFGHPMAITLGSVIQGWTEALTKMKPGAKWRLFIPPSLAYEDVGMAPFVGPRATLIYDMELVSIVGAPPPPPAPPPTMKSDVIMVPSADQIEKGAEYKIIKAADVERMEKEFMEEQQRKAALTNKAAKATKP